MHIPTLRKNKQRKPRALGVLLCYNDADVLEDAIKHLLANNHELVVWDHGSDDDTPKVLDKYDGRFLERDFIPRSFDFYKLYQRMSRHLIDTYVSEFDWISWPDQDEILEGPRRDKTYYEYLTQVFNSPYDWIQFNNFNYWFTDKDDISIASPVERVKHYCLFPGCAPRVRSWRASVTNIREFNHNPLPGERFPEFFNLRHFPMRTKAQMLKRLDKDRASLQRGTKNVHYNNMNKVRDKLLISPDKLHLDNGKDLDHSVVFDWNDIYFAK